MALLAGILAALVTLLLLSYCVWKGEISEHFSTATGIRNYNNMLPYTVCCRNRRKKTVVSTAVAMSGIATDGNAAKINCGKSIPNDASEFTETSPQTHCENVTACLPPVASECRYFEAPLNAPRVMFMASDGRSSPEYESVEDAGFQSHREFYTVRFQ